MVAQTLPNMQFSEFQVGLKFYTATGKWQCTDLGSRVAVAIKLDEHDETWLSGPPFAVPEVVFDEYDIKGCFLEPPSFDHS